MLKAFSSLFAKIVAAIMLPVAFVAVILHSSQAVAIKPSPIALVSQVESVVPMENASAAEPVVPALTNPVSENQKTEIDKLRKEIQELKKTRISEIQAAQPLPSIVVPQPIDPPVVNPAIEVPTPTA